MVSVTVPARAGLLGNPSDGYGGRTLAVPVRGLAATVSVELADEVEVVGPPDDELVFGGFAEMVSHVDRFGYGRGTSLVMAAARRFWDLRDEAGMPMPGGMRASYRTTIPRQVGLAGSSAIVIATIRCLATLVDAELPPEVVATMAWQAETEQLGVTAGLQDRVVQSFDAPVAMDFSELTPAPKFGVPVGRYEELDEATLPPLFIAYSTGAAAPSGEYHQTLRSAYSAGDRQVRDALRQLAALVTEGRAALRWGAVDRFGDLLGENMALRRLLGPIPDQQLALVDLAADCGVATTFAGSGGAVVGVYPTVDKLDELRLVYADAGAEVMVVT